VAFTQSSAANAWYEDQNLTAAAPSAASDGVLLKDIDSLVVVVEANSGQTLSGAGNLRCYLYDPLVAGWFRVTANDQAVTTSGVRRVGYSLDVIGCRTGSRVVFVTDSVTVSSGTTVRVYLLGGRERGE